MTCKEAATLGEFTLEGVDQSGDFSGWAKIFRLIPSDFHESKYAKQELICSLLNYLDITILDLLDLFFSSDRLDVIRKATGFTTFQTNRRFGPNLVLWDHWMTRFTESP